MSGKTWQNSMVDIFFSSWSKNGLDPLGLFAFKEKCRHEMAAVEVECEEHFMASFASDNGIHFYYGGIWMGLDVKPEKSL